MFAIGMNANLEIIEAKCLSSKRELLLAAFACVKARISRNIKECLFWRVFSPRLIKVHFHQCLLIFIMFIIILKKKPECQKAS